MDSFDYYSDKKWCPVCGDYVAYLMSVEHSYCVACGSEVRLFSDEDWEAFNESMQAKRPKGGRPRKKAGADAAGNTKTAPAPKAREAGDDKAPKRRGRESA